MMNEEHERLRALVTRFVEGAADAVERAEVESHLAICPECRADLEVERRSREAMMRETRAFSEGYDAGRLEADLKNELRSGATWTRWLLALGVLFGLLTLVLFLRPLASQPAAWSATLALSGGFLGSLYWILRRQAKMAAIARAAETVRGGYRNLERARVDVVIRDLRACARFGIAGGVALPIVLGAFGLVERLRLRHAFPNAEVHVNISDALVNVAVVSAFTIAGSLYCLRKARQLEAAEEERMEANDERH